MRPVLFVSATTGRTVLAVAGLAALAVAVAVGFFGLRVIGSLSLYFIIWWTLIFAALPFGVRSQEEEGSVVQGSEPGAPSLPKLREKAVWTSLAAGIVLAAAASLLPLAGL